MTFLNIYDFLDCTNIEFLADTNKKIIIFMVLPITRPILEIYTNSKKPQINNLYASKFDELMYIIRNEGSFFL